MEVILVDDDVLVDAVAGGEVSRVLIVLLIVARP